jgi:hypothetical protein
MLAVLLSREKGLASERQGSEEGRWRQVPHIVTRTRSENGQKGRINYGASLGWGAADPPADGNVSLNQPARRASRASRVRAAIGPWVS